MSSVLSTLYVKKKKSDVRLVRASIPQLKLLTSDVVMSRSVRSLLGFTVLTFSCKYE